MNTVIQESYRYVYVCECVLDVMNCCNLYFTICIANSSPEVHHTDHVTHCNNARQSTIDKSYSNYHRICLLVADHYECSPVTKNPQKKRGQSIY